MTEVEKLLLEALARIRSKSEMWQQVANSTASVKGVPPWWNLGNIAASAIKKAAEQGVQLTENGHGESDGESSPAVFSN